MKTGLAAILFIAACTSSSNNQPACGDGIVDSGEQCDDGNTNNGDGCSSTCQTEGPPNVCGDGALGGSEQCDDGNTTAGDGCSADCKSEFKITSNWTFKNAGQTTTCPNGYDTAAVYTQPLDGQGQPVGSPVIDLWDCSAGTGTTAFLAQGTYETYIAITNHGGTLTFGTTVPADVPLTTANATYSADIVEDGGYFGWKWMLQGAQSNNPLTCAQVSGIQGVELITTVSGGSQAYTDQFTCEDGQGVTAVIPQGLYTVAPDAFSSGGKIGDAPALNNQQIRATAADKWDGGCDA
jgi:cysteine-rich repeat protein